MPTAPLRYHIVPGEVLAAGLSDGPAPRTLQGSALSIEVDDGVAISAWARSRRSRGSTSRAKSPARSATIAFEAGQQVRRGDPLIDLDASTERAALAVTQARLDEAVKDQERDAELLERRVIAPEVAEDSAFTVSRLRAKMEQAEAALALKSISTPLDGTSGIRRVDPGQFVQPGDATVTLQQLSDVLVLFEVPERRIAGIEVGQSLSAIFAAYSGRVFDGVVTVRIPAVSATSRGPSIQAEIGNEDRALLPGMFAEIEPDLGQTRSVPLVPQTAVTFNAYGASVFLVSEPEPEEDGDPGAGEEESGGPELVAVRTFVEIGERRGTAIEIVSGLADGDRVVTGGRVDLADGSPIRLPEEEPLSEIDADPATPGLGE